MTTALVILSVFCIATYTTAVCVKFNGVPESISATFYSLEHKFWFGTTMFLTAGLLMPAILEITPEGYQFVAFLACTGMAFVGAAPNFREGLDKQVHKASAVTCIVFSQVWIALTCPWVLTVWIAHLIYTALMMKKKWKGNFISAFLLPSLCFGWR